MSERAPIDWHGIAGCVLAIAGGAAAWYHAKEFSPMGAVFPRTLAVVMIIGAMAYIVVAFVRPARQAAKAQGSVWRRFALVAVMAAWSLFLEQVGFLATSSVCFAAILLIANYDRWTPRMAAVYAVASAIVVGGLYAIFRFVLQVPLPEGMLL
jgi:putative tricarboxylic transport membrane protein